jgi:hypothetical protein
LSPAFGNNCTVAASHFCSLAQLSTLPIFMLKLQDDTKGDDMKYYSPLPDALKIN